MFDEFHSENFQSNYSSPYQQRDELAGYNSASDYDSDRKFDQPLGSLGSEDQGRGRRTVTPDLMRGKDKVLVKSPDSRYQPRLSATKQKRGRQAA